MRLKVAAGTRNPSKLSGIEAAFKEVLGVDAVVVGVAVKTDVPPQPIGFDSIIKGALERGFRAIRAVEDALLGVGVEAGIYRLGSRYFDVQAAAIVCRDSLLSLGFSPSFEIPPSFASKLVSGEEPELEAVVDKHFGTKDIGEKGGLISILTRGAVTREHLTRDAVAMALVPLANSGLYGVRVPGRD